jgi:hypothetical protein
MVVRRLQAKHPNFGPILRRSRAPSQN